MRRGARAAGRDRGRDDDGQRPSVRLSAARGDVLRCGGVGTGARAPSNGDAPKATTRCATPSCSASSRPRTAPTCATSSARPSAGATPAPAIMPSARSASATSRRWKTSARDAGSTKAPVTPVSPPRRGAHATTSVPARASTRRTSTGSSGSTASSTTTGPSGVEIVVRSTEASAVTHSCRQSHGSSSSQPLPGGARDPEAKLGHVARAVDVGPDQPLDLAPRRERREQGAVAEHGGQ